MKPRVMISLVDKKYITFEVFSSELDMLPGQTLQNYLNPERLFEKQKSEVTQELIDRTEYVYTSLFLPAKIIKDQMMKKENDKS